MIFNGTSLYAVKLTTKTLSYTWIFKAKKDLFMVQFLFFLLKKKTLNCSGLLLCYRTPLRLAFIQGLNPKPLSLPGAVQPTNSQAPVTTLPSEHGALGYLCIMY